MDGIGRSMPFTMVAFFVASLSIIGLPPTGGTWSKWYLLLGAAEGHEVIFMFVLMLSSLLSIAYLMPVVARAFFVEASTPDDEKRSEGIHEAPLLCVAPLCLTAAGCLLLFVYAGPIYRLLLPVAGSGG